MSSNKTSPGHMVARTLAGSWRSSPPALALSFDELQSITPLLIQSGAGALAWWRLRNSPLAASAAATELREAYRLHRLQSSLHLRKIKNVMSLLAEVNIEPLLMKGWSVARLYPEAGLRHFIDVDLCVAPDEYARADETLNRALGADRCYVDLHSALGHLEDIEWADLRARSEVIALDGMAVRVLGAADHLRILCTHWLGHGAWRPAGLCDIAVALESRLADFDWNVCLGRDRKRASWVAATIGLARELLDIEMNGMPFSLRERKLPGWLVPAVLRQWTRCVGPNGNGMALPALLGQVASPANFAREIYARWDNPVHATVELRGSFNNWPRLPYQIAALALRVPEVPRQLAVMMRDRARKTSGFAFAAERR